jgi:hypothetical protein
VGKWFSFEGVQKSGRGKMRHEDNGVALQGDKVKVKPTTAAKTLVGAKTAPSKEPAPTPRLDQDSRAAILTP